MAALSISVHKVGILMAGCIALAVSSSCADESEADGGNRNAIGFEITSTGENAPQSRAAQSVEPPVLLYACNSDSLFLHTTTADNPSPADESPNTRGIPVNSTNFKSAFGAFGVKAYVDGSTPYMDDKVGTEDNGVWMPDGGPRYWPGSESLDFYAYAPYDNAVADMSCSGNKIEFSYTVPRSTDGKDDGKAQPDLMFAYTSCNVKTASGRVSLAFHHALAAIRFEAYKTTNGTIESISIKNVYGSGTCTYDNSNATDHFAWVPTGERGDFGQDFNVEVKDGQTERQEITDKNPETTFMMIPQNLEGAVVEVVFTAKDGQKHTLQAPFKADSKWEAGKIYTYTISQVHS